MLAVSNKLATQTNIKCNIGQGKGIKRKTKQKQKTTFFLVTVFKKNSESYKSISAIFTATKWSTTYIECK